MIETVFFLLFAASSVAFSLDEFCAVQQNAYRSARGIMQNKKKRYIEAAALIVIGAVTGLAAFYSPLAGTILTFLALPACIFYFSFRYYKRRTKFRFTNRGVRLLFIAAFVMFMLHSAGNALSREPYQLFLAGYAVLCCSRLLVLLVNAAVRPFEAMNNRRYLRAAKKRREGLCAVKIGITGSFGKTGCKNILAAMLSKKYKVLKTAGNYNTPMGICLTAKEIKGDEEVFIAEMGARRQGDIKELCGLVEPAYAIITGVSNQHLASFKSLENIYSTKKELVDCLPADGYAVFNGDNPGSLKMSLDCRAESAVVYTMKSTGIHAGQIKLTNAGSTFVIAGLGEPFTVTTKLLGRHKIINILLCAALAYRLGISTKQIQEAAEGLCASPHRLELVPNSRSITIIDDSYNANIEGAGFALEVLKQFPGRKVLFTQGVVELGKEQQEVNTDLGVMAAAAADVVLLTGENTAAIAKGLEKAGFPGEIHRYESLQAAQEAFAAVLREGDVLLIQNDIP